MVRSLKRAMKLSLVAILALVSSALAASDDVPSIEHGKS